MKWGQLRRGPLLSVELGKLWPSHEVHCLSSHWKTWICCWYDSKSSKWPKLIFCLSACSSNKIWNDPVKHKMQRAAVSRKVSSLWSGCNELADKKAFPMVMNWTPCSRYLLRAFPFTSVWSLVIGVKMKKKDLAFMVHCYEVHSDLVRCLELELDLKSSGGSRKSTTLDSLSLAFHVPKSAN